MKNRKIIAICVAVIMCLSMLTGCDILPPKTPAELIQRSSRAMAELDNYRMTMDMDIGIDMTGDVEGLDMNMSMPIGLSMKLNRAGNYAAGDMKLDATINATVSYMGESEDMNEDVSKSVDFYMVMDEDDEKYTTYMNDDDSGWVRSESDDDEDDSIDIADLLNCDEEMSDCNAVMEKNDGVYVVTMDFAGMFENENFTDFMDENMGDTKIDWDEFADAVGDARVVYKFDAKTYRLLSISVDEIEIDDISFMTGIAGIDTDDMNIDDMSFTMSLSIEFDKFDKIDVEDVKVPDDVIDAAIDGVDDGGGNEWLPTSNPVGEPTETTEPVATDADVDNGNGSTDAPAHITETEVAFAYNGTVLNIPTDYQVFVDDGWYPVDDGEYGSFLCMEHAKYPSVTLYLNTNDYSGSESYVKEHGSDGFSIMISPEDAYPNFTLSGIKFCDDLTTVKNNLGEPDDSYVSSDSYGTYESYEWEVEYDGFDCTLTVCLDNGKVVEMGISHW